MSAKKEITQDRRGLMVLMRQAAHNKSLYDVFRDFVEMGAISLSNAVDVSPQREVREQRYLDLVKTYDAETAALFPKMLGCLVGELDNGFDDVLGKTFMELDLANKQAGQFFTPYELCRLMASLNVDERTKETIKAKGFITVNDPAVGGGAQLIAFAEAMRGLDLNPQTQMHATAQDIDARAVHMTYLQLSLLHIPARVILGDTIRMEVREVWYTPAHILGGWNWKLKRQEETPVPPAVEIKSPVPILAGTQAELFI